MMDNSKNVWSIVYKKQFYFYNRTWQLATILYYIILYCMHMHMWLDPSYLAEFVLLIILNSKLLHELVSLNKWNGHLHVGGWQLLSSLLAKGKPSICLCFFLIKKCTFLDTHNYFVLIALLPQWNSDDVYNTVHVCGTLMHTCSPRSHLQCRIAFSQPSSCLELCLI